MAKLKPGWATACAKHLRETKGKEFTPAEVRRTAESALSKIRQHMRDRGYNVPDGDQEMLELVQQAKRDHDERERRIAEIEKALSEPIDESSLPELTPEEKKRLDESCERILKKVMSRIAETKKPHIVKIDGSPVAMFENAADARDDAYDRNRRASRLGVSARYYVEYEPPDDPNHEALGD